MVGADRDQRRLGGPAFVYGQWAARRERAAGRQRGQRRRRTGDRHQSLALRSVESGNRAEQTRGVGHPAVAVELPDRGHLDGTTGVHHQRAVGELGDHPEVVGDDQHAGAGHVTRRLQHLEDLRLHGDVQRGGRFVADE